MNESIVIHLHLGGIETSREHHASETQTFEELITLLIKAGHFGDAKVEEIFVFEENSDIEVPHNHILRHEHHGKKYHLHRCKHIAVKFIAVDETKTESFRPSRTITHLLKWAKEHLANDPNKKYELRLTADGEPLPAAAHLGSYAKPGECSVTLYYVPACKILG